MRLAILSALADPFGHAGASAGERPAFRRFAGKSVLSHQIDCAAHLGCDRVICLVGGLGPDMGAARAYAERAGIRFEIAESNLRLASQITADDEVIVLADGVLPDRPALVGALAERQGVAAFPADEGVERGFERLDASRAWSGALRMRGDGVARLADLPPDCDLASSLLRIALQSGLRVAELDPALLMEGTWQRRVDRQTAAEAEQRWISRQVQPAPFVAPGRAVADRMALRWARDARAGRWMRAPHFAAALAGALALVAGLAGAPMSGLGLLLAASFALAVAEVFDRVETLGAPPRKKLSILPLARLARDGSLFGLLALLIAAEPDWLRAFLPLLLVALLHLGATIVRQPLCSLYADRIVLLVLILPAAAQGWTGVAVAGLTLLALAALLWSAPRSQAKLTAN